MAAEKVKVKKKAEQHAASSAYTEINNLRP